MTEKDDKETFTKRLDEMCLKYIEDTTLSESDIADILVSRKNKLKYDNKYPHEV